MEMQLFAVGGTQAPWRWSTSTSGEFSNLQTSAGAASAGVAHGHMGGQMYTVIARAHAIVFLENGTPGALPAVRSSLAELARDARRRLVAQGVTLMSIDQINDAVAEMRRTPSEP